MKVKEAMKLCQEHGWHLVKIKGSHRHFKHFKYPGKITIPGATVSKELKPGIKSQILKKLSLKVVN